MRGRPARRPCAPRRRAASRNAAVNASERRPRSRAARNCGTMRAHEAASAGVRRTSNATNTTAAATCETTFAIAEPSMPSPKPRISASESATLARFEATSTAKPVRVSWNARSQPCAAAITSMNGAPSAAMRNHVSASCSESLSLGARDQTQRRAGRELERDRDDGAQRERQPGRLHADVERLGLAVRRRTGGPPWPSCRTPGTCTGRRSRRAACRRLRGRPAARGRGARRSPCRPARRAARRPVRPAPAARAR